MPSQRHSSSIRDSDVEDEQDSDGQKLRAADEDPDETESGEAEPNTSESEDDEGTKRYNEAMMKQGKATGKVRCHEGVVICDMLTLH